MNNYDKKLAILKKITDHLGPEWVYYDRMRKEMEAGISEERLTYYVDTLTKAIDEIHEKKKKDKMLGGLSKLKQIHLREQQQKIQDEADLDEILKQMDSL